MVYIPGFLVNKVYKRGSLQNTPEGFEFCFQNTMTPLKISGMRELLLTVDGIPYPQETVTLQLGDRTFNISDEPLTELVSFAKHSKLFIRVRGANLPEGPHVIKISFMTREYGGVSLKVKDVLGEVARRSRWQRLKDFILRRGPHAKFRPIAVSGTLGGVPLAPDFARLEAALRHEVPDRVPLFEAEIEIPIKEAFLGREINDAADEVEFYIRAGYDFVPVVPPYFTPSLMRTATGDERGWITESEGIIKNRADFDAFPWPDPAEVDFSSFHEIARLLPPKMKILGLLSPAAVFGNASQAMGLENFSYALYDDVPLVEALFEKTGSSYVAIAKKLVTMPKLGAVLMSDDLAHTGGCLVSPKVYRKYVFPWYKQIGDILGDAGIPFIFHSDGDFSAVFDDLAACGVKAIHPIEPQAMDIETVKQQVGDQFCIFGNVDLDYTLTRGTPAEVDALVREKIKKLAPGGGYGVAASNSIPDYVKPENFRAMVAAVKKYGRYPIQLP